MNPLTLAPTKRRVSLSIPSPIGVVRVISDGSALIGLFLPNHRGEPELDEGETEPTEDAVLQAADRQIRAFFDGTLRSFDLPLNLTGTDFQLKVWKELLNIPCGTTISYAELARRIGQPTASRAVGLANGRNPISIIVPCHRVIGADGSLTGYGGGLDAKRWLLHHESGVPASSERFALVTS